MMLASGTSGDGKPLYFVGLDAENIKRLTAGQPIHVRLEQVGGAGVVWLIYGHTLGDVINDLRKAGVQWPLGATP
jgi:hypothetical protein